MARGYIGGERNWIDMLIVGRDLASVARPDKKILDQGQTGQVWRRLLS